MAAPNFVIGFPCHFGGGFSLCTHPCRESVSQRRRMDGAASGGKGAFPTRLWACGGIVLIRKGKR